MANVLVVNDYPMVDVEAGVRAGRVPNHLLYGVDHLRRVGHHVTEVSGHERQALHRLDLHMKKLPLPIGSLESQLRVLERLRGVDVIYAPCHLRLHLLCLARAHGLFRTPMICLVHHPLARGRARRLRTPWLRAVIGHGRGARFATLSSAVAAEVNEIAGASVAEAIPWGPDAGFYPRPTYPGTGVIAAGRTGRDFLTLARAARLTGTPVTIISWAEYLEPIRAELDAPNIETIYVGEQMIAHSELAARFAEARAIAVPLADGDSLAGLTGVMDALGAGKPLLITRRATLDLDPEREGFGRNLDSGDVEGWARALRDMEQRPDEAVAMGRRARALVDGGLTSESFGARIAERIDAALR